MIYEISVLATVALMVVSAIDYVRRAWSRKITPVPATWILMNVVFVLLFWMYWHSPNKSWTANIAVTSGFFNVVIILIGVIAAHVRHHSLRVAFDKVQYWCLAGGGIIVMFWLLTNQLLISYILVQLIALVAYTATAKKLWKAEYSTEPLFLWVSVLLATLCAIYPAWVKNDLFSWIYLIRAVPSLAFMIYLIVRIKLRMRESVN